MALNDAQPPVAADAPLASRRDPAFREVFRNCYATGFAFRSLLMMMVHLVLGLTFTMVLLLSAGYVALALLYIASGLDPIGLKGHVPRELPSIETLIGEIVAGVSGSAPSPTSARTA